MAASNLFLLLHLKIKKLDFEFQSSIWWNNWWSTLSSISIFWRADECSLLSFLELSNSFIPCSNYLSNTNLEFKWLIPLNGRIEDSTIQECSMIVAFDKSSLWADLTLSLIVNQDLEFRLLLLLLLLRHSLLHLLSSLHLYILNF